jgi:integrase
MAGQIIKRGENKYLVRIFLGREGGKKKYHNKTINGNKKDADRYLRKVLREKDLGELVEPSKQILKEYLDTWLDTAVKIRVRERTYRDYKEKVKLYIKPALGDFKLQTLSPEQIQGLYNKMLDEGKSARTVRLTHTILKNALLQAVKWGKITRNPADLVDLPRQNRTEMKVLTPDQAAAFMKATVLDKWKPFFSLMLSSGVRPGEALGLKWSDVDFVKNRITICRSLTRTEGGGWELQEPKTNRSRRTIPLPAGVIDDLKELKQKQDQEAAERKRVIKWNLKGKETAEKYNDHDFVFASDNGEPMSDKNLFRRHFKPLLKDAKLPDIRLYDLRHTCATLLLAAGENPKIVSERLGHASITLTLDTYSHVLPDMQQAAVEKLEALLFKKEPAEEQK